MDVIFDETRVRTCRHRIYKRNLVSVKKKLNLKQRIMATVLVLVREVTTETASMATDKQTKWFSLQIISFTPCLKKNQKQTQKKQHFG